MRANPSGYLQDISLLLGERLFSRLVMYAQPLAHIGNAHALHSYDRSYHYGQLIGVDILLKRQGTALIADMCNIPPLQLEIESDTNDVGAVAREVSKYYQTVAAQWLVYNAVFKEITPIAVEALKLPDDHRAFVESGIGFAAFLGDQAPDLLMQANIWPVSMEKISPN